MAIVATGGTITTDGNYTVHKFTGDGTFEVTSGSDNVQLLIVAGGGGGAFAGGGAGGVKFVASEAVSVGTYSIVPGDSGPLRGFATSFLCGVPISAEGGVTTGEDTFSSCILLSKEPIEPPIDEYGDIYFSFLIY